MRSPKLIPSLTTSSRLLPALAALALSTSLVAGLAQAQTASAPAPAKPVASAPKGRDLPDPAQRAQEHLARLKADLKITAAQDKAWQAFAAQATQQAQAMKTQHDQQPDRAELAKLHAPERMARHTEQMKQHLAAMETLNKAVKDLYAVLTPEQQTLADKHFERMHRGMGGKGGRDGEHGKGHGHGGRGHDR